MATRRRFHLIAAFGAAVCVLVVPARGIAQDYPSKPVRLIVNTAAGGLMDVAARAAADHRPIWGRDVQICGGRRHPACPLSRPGPQ